MGKKLLDDLHLGLRVWNSNLVTLLTNISATLYYLEKGKSVSQFCQLYISFVRSQYNFFLQKNKRFEKRGMLFRKIY